MPEFLVDGVWAFLLIAWLLISCVMPLFGGMYLASRSRPRAEVLLFGLAILCLLSIAYSLLVIAAVAAHTLL